MAYLWGKLCLYAGGFSGLLVTFNPHPFAEGSEKQSHEAIYDGAPNKHGHRAVVKKLKNTEDLSPLYIKRGLEREVRAHRLTAHFANTWNQLNRSTQRIHVQVPYISQIRVHKKDDMLSTFGFLNRYRHEDGDYITVEDYIDGKFEKFNSNTGWVRDRKACINAFSHWTYHHSNGEYLVCDLQGVQRRNSGSDGEQCDCYELTDPVIMSSKDKKFGQTDLGMVGISNWFYHHQCNEFCDATWRKPEVIAKSDEIDCEQETSHSAHLMHWEQV
eukprot:CAMPEP_0197046740 /NCGR_PEP_ID=MMETSP1384-20130603/22395_1 /TAXON_ID=29189 /ORGANISM="Ammonia sp." /LENGTH=271 /DNA_ID=CAMNT_0042478575 /DNA_START=39 /DNA_END=854 /DNA_ORIENTATION=-